MDKYFHYELHHKIPADFRPGEVVGAGSFGRVVLLEDPEHLKRKDFVIKEIFLEESKVKQNAARIHVEVAILSALHHQHIVQFYGCKFEKNKIWIFLAYTQKGSLKDYIEEKKKEIEQNCIVHMDATTEEQKKQLTKTYIEENGVLSEETTSLFTYQILKGLIYLHDNLIIHRDIKGANILLDQDLKIKLADFGISKILRNQTTNTSEMGTVKWMAPEIINEKPYDFKVDIWSVGATVVEMVTGSPPFPDQELTRVILHMATNPTAQFRLTDASSENLKLFLNSTFKAMPEERPTSRELIKELFVADNNNDTTTETDMSDQIKLSNDNNNDTTTETDMSDQIKLSNDDVETEANIEDENKFKDSSFHTHSFICKKNPRHEMFIPVNQFATHHLPHGYHDNELVQLVQALADLTVRIAVNFTSPDRPEFIPGTKDPYPFYNTRGRKVMRTGTGRVEHITKYTEGMPSYRTCPCPECDHSDTPSKVWWEVCVVMARHLVFDESEARKSSCRLWFDDDKSPKFNMCGWKVGGWMLDIESDRCLLFCATHDVDVADKLEEILRRYACINEKVDDRYKSRRDVDKLTIIVSHPHCWSKKVSVGYWVDREYKGDVWTRYTYTTATCPGSGGAYVYRLGYGSSTHVHSGAHSSGLQFSSLGWL